MSACFQVTELAGYTARVSEMLDVFEDVNQGIYRRSADRDEELTAAGSEGAVVQHGQRVYCRLLEMRGESPFIYVKLFAVTENQLVSVWVRG